MDPSKRCKNEDNVNKNDKRQQIETVLLPGLPNHLAHLCLSHLQPSLLYNICKSWRRLIYSPNFPPFSTVYTVLTPIRSNQSSQQNQSSHSVGFFSFDPFSSKWIPLPNPPSDPPLSLICQHPSFISRILPVQSITATGRLILISANTHNFLPALASPLIFDPLSTKWSTGPPLPTPRRWCATGSVHGAVYVASGVGPQYQSDVARSLEIWDMKKKEAEWSWEKKASFRDGRFSREAIEAVGYKGKLCMVNVKGKSIKEGAVYDVGRNQWDEMPKGMVAGWNGPATVDDDIMYVVDQESGSLSKYDGDSDSWQELIGPSENLRGAEHIAAEQGKVFVVAAGGGRIAVVDILERPFNVWILDPPPGMEVIAVHVLPRMSFTE